MEEEERIRTRYGMEDNMKKAQAGIDTIFAIASIFGLVVFCLIAIYTYSEFLDVANTTVMNQTPAAIDAMAEIEGVNEMWDYVILVIFIGFAIAMLILGYFVDVETVFFPIYIIVLLIGLVIAAVLSYTWDQITTQAGIFTALELTHFPIMSHILDNFVIYYVIIGVMALTATYAKTRGQVV